MAAADTIDAPPTTTARRGDHSALALALGLTLLCLLPVAVVVVTRAGRSYLPIQDIAVIDLRVRGVWSTDIPLVGAYSRLGWSHPGPLMFYLLAPLSLLTGGAAWATLVGSALLQGVAIAWTARLSWVRGGAPLVALWLAITALAYAATGPWILLEAWNPHVVYPYFVLFLLQAWLIATGEDRRLLGAAFVASFLVQGHIGYLPLVAAIALWALWRRRQDLHRDGRRLRDLRAWRPTALLTAVVWLPPVVENVLHPPGNVARMARAFILGDGQGPTVGVLDATGLLAAPYRFIPPWLGGPDLYDAFTREARPASIAWLLVPVVLVALALRVTAGKGEVEDRRLLELVVVTLVIGWVAITRVTGDLNPYLFYWRLVMAPLAIVVPLWVLAGHVRGRARWARRGGLALLCLAVAWGGTGLALEVADAPRPVMAFEDTTQALLDQVVEGGEPTGSVLVRPAGSALGGVQGGVVDELDRRGQAVRVDETITARFGYDLISDPEDVDAVWYVAEQGHELSYLMTLPGARLVARTQPLDPSDEAELTALQQGLIAQLSEAGATEADATDADREDDADRGTDDADPIDALSSPLADLALDGVPGVSRDQGDRLAQLNQRVTESGTCRCAIVAFPADQAPCRRAVRKHVPVEDVAQTCVRHR